MKRRLLSFVILVALVALVVAIDVRTRSAIGSLAAFAVLSALGLRELMVLLTGPAWSRALRGLLLLGLPMACVVALRLRPDGLGQVLYLLAVTKMTDNGALFIGRQWGVRKLAPRISPGKTVAGLWGGLAVGTLTAGALAPWCTGQSPGAALAGGLLLSGLAVLGDLGESWLKRRAGVKDSGALLPGIGGVLDLLDSVLLAAPAAWLLTAG